MYLSPYALNWLAGKMAAEAIIVSAHTAAPGNAGTANELSSAGARNYARKAVNANRWTATGATADNDNVETVFTPNAASAGDVVTHLGYWLGNDFFGWVQLAAPVTLVRGEPFRIASGTMDFTFELAS